AQGLRVYGDTCVASMEETASNVTLQTAAGRVTAQAVVLATGYEAYEQVPAIESRLQTTYAAALSPAEVPGWPERCLIWETARPYFYGRRTDDGRVIVGGGDTQFAEDHERDGLIAEKTERLMRRVRELFPAAEPSPAYAWGGTFAE